MSSPGFARRSATSAMHFSYIGGRSSVISCSSPFGLRSGSPKPIRVLIDSAQGLSSDGIEPHEAADHPGHDRLGDVRHEVTGLLSLESRPSRGR